MDEMTLDLFDQSNTPSGGVPGDGAAKPEEDAVGMEIPPVNPDPEAAHPLLEEVAVDPAGGSGGGGGDGSGEMPPDEGEYHPLGIYAEHAYLAYAMSVVKGRAIPDVSDGLKHVQRRILYAMSELGVTRAAKPVKSARVVGEVLGKFHPHSDKAAYDAMVRLAQDFNMRYPLIDGEGNFGSRDGDSAAAMRYTEARLSGLAELLLSEIHQGTVEFIANYDGTLEEPRLLPARLPMILLNGQTGIGVGLATEIPSHNMREVARAAIELIRKPNLNVAQLMEHISGPDFPGGGQIITSAKDLVSAYESGRGTMRVRCRYTVEPQARGQWRIIVHEFPHGVSASQVLAEIDALTNPQPRKGEKDISVAQKHLKQLFLGMLDAVRDESDQQSPVRLVLEPRSSRQSPDEFMHAFLTHTSLETNYAMNLVVIGIDGKPTQKNLRDILSEWVSYRFDTVTRRSRYRLGKVEDRIHILEGRQTVLLNIDEVIRIIRESDEPKAALIARFALSDRQAEDILEIRLRQLARLEALKIQQELDALCGERDELNKLLADPAVMKRLVIKEIKADAEKYGDARRTLIEPAVAASFAQTVANEPVTIILSQKGWVRARSGHGVDVAGLTYKDGDAFHSSLEVRSVDTLYFLDDKGRAYSVQASLVPGGRGEGVPLTTLMDIQAGARVSWMLAGRNEDRFLFANSGGYGFVAQLGDLASRQRAGKAFMTLDSGETVLQPVLVPEAETAHVAVLASDLHLLVYPAQEVKVLAKGRGVQLMSLVKKESIRQVMIYATPKARVAATGRGGKAVELCLAGKDLEPFLGHRAKRGGLLNKSLKQPRLLAEADSDAEKA